MVVLVAIMLFTDKLHCIAIPCVALYYIVCVAFRCVSLSCISLCWVKIDRHTNVIVLL